MSGSTSKRSVFLLCCFLLLAYWYAKIDPQISMENQFKQHALALDNLQRTTGLCLSHLHVDVNFVVFWDGILPLRPYAQRNFDGALATTDKLLGVLQQMTDYYQNSAFGMRPFLLNQAQYYRRVAIDVKEAMRGVRSFSLNTPPELRQYLPEVERRFAVLCDRVLTRLRRLHSREIFMFGAPNSGRGLPQGLEPIAISEGLF